MAGGKGQPFPRAETTQAVMDAILTGVHVTCDYVVERGWAEDRRRASAIIHLARRLLAQHHPEVPVGYIPGNNGDLGSHQRLDTLAEVVQADRCRIKRVKHQIVGMDDSIANSTQELSAPEKSAAMAILEIPFVEVLVANQAAMYHFVLAQGDAKAKKRMEANLRRLLKEGQDDTAS